MNNLKSFIDINLGGVLETSLLSTLKSENLILYYAELTDNINIQYYLPEILFFSFLLYLLIYSIVLRLHFSYRVINLYLNLLLIV